MKNVVFKPLKLCAIGLAMIVALAACTTSTAPITSHNDGKVAYIANVTISANQTEADLERMYGGKVQLYAPEAGFAVLGFTESEGELTTLSTSPNLELSLDDFVDTGETAWGSGNSAWASGTSAWASGTSAWASGTSAWASGISLPSESLATLNMINISEAHKMASNHGEGITVAVIDTGLDLDHPAFEGRLAPSYQWIDRVDYDNVPEDEIAPGASGSMYGHGTAVAGLIAQVAPKATILPIRVLDAEGNGSLIDVIIGMYYAIIYGADVINVSIGTDSPNPTLQMIVNYAASYFSHVVVAAGNGGTTPMDYPASFANTGSQEGQLLSVGSVDASGQLSAFSNYGSDLEFVAPGEGVFSSYPDDQVGFFSGTSFSTPILAGMIALGLGEAPGTTQMETYLASSVDNALGTITAMGTGYGIPKADAMLTALPSGNPTSDSVTGIGW